MTMYKHLGHVAISAALAAGLTVLTGTAQAHGMTKSDIRSAQQQLKNGGYYKGSVDGIDGRMTRFAIRKYQKDNSLSVNGRFDRETCQKLGVSRTGEASRSAESGDQNKATGNNTPADNNYLSKSTIQNAQRQLKEKGLYTGKADGVMSRETEDAIRKFQQNNGLTATGQLDQDTMNKLGVSRK